MYSIGGINGFGIRISEVGMAEAEEAGEAVEGAGSPGQSLQIARRRHERLNFSNEARATQIHSILRPSRVAYIVPYFHQITAKYGEHHFDQ